MSGNEIRQKYLDFMKERGHAIIPSSALIPENDPTTLFTGSGMQPLVPFLMGEQHPMGTRLADSQKCFRAEDIDEVGDNRHTTFFEMLGNWSLGDYFKEEQLSWLYSFLVDEIKLDPNKLYVTVFAGDELNGIARDEESVTLWKELFAKKGLSNEAALMGTEEGAAARGMKEGERIFYYTDKNWWSRSGKPSNMPVGEIGGPDSEIFYDFETEHDTRFGEHCHPNCDCGRFLEIGNSVFMEFIKTESGFQRLPQKNVDFGGGLERIAAAKLGTADVFKVDLLQRIVQQIEVLSGKSYEDNSEAFRIITDHVRGAVFIIADGVLPSNTEQGYFVRRLVRRSVRFADALGIPEGKLKNLAESVIDTYRDHYTDLVEKRQAIMNAIANEEAQFRRTLEQGLREFEKMAKQGTVSAEDAFVLFSTHGFPYEFTVELASERGIAVDRAGFEHEMQKHQERSRSGAEQRFKGGLADNSEKVVAYHTATHLLLAGLRHELGDEVHQAGSNITAERLRFDVTYPERIDRSVLDRVEAYVNDAIKAGAAVTIETMSKEEAQKDPSIEGSFWERYPDEVKVYTIKDASGKIYSRELCGGPHVESTSVITGTFKITKEESSAAGVRRIRAVLE